MFVINAEQQKNLSNMKEIIDSVALSLKEYSAGNTETPIRIALSAEKGNTLVMPSLAESLGSLGVKITTVYPENPKNGKKTINGIVLLLDVKTGEPLAILDGAYLTMVRTGALSGVATQYLARKDSTSLSIIGTGVQAEGLCDAVMAVRDIKQIKLYNRSFAKAENFSKQITNKYPHVDVSIHDNPSEAVKNSDIIVTATSSKTPVLPNDIKLKKGVHINGVGSFRPNMQEIPTEIISTASKVVVEAKDAALEETGDLQIPIKIGKFREDDIYGELGNIISGKLPGRENDEEMTVFKSVGIATADAVVANYIYERALESDYDIKIDL
mgnify:CR=1 FL=1